ncbi:MAG TPA: hypothetical protein VHD36_01920 [Pirellulales bacterium]|nr:hypothetical protein [Pirellulales bacterium]
MAVLQFGCPFCGAVSEVDASQAGQQTICPACDNVLLVPQAPDDTATGVEEVSVEELRRSVPTGKRKGTRTKLWQTTPETEAAGKSSAIDADLPQPAAMPTTSTQSRSPSGANEVVDLFSQADAITPDDRSGRRAERVLHDERVRRRAISNAVMLVGSIVILVAALGVLLYLSKR